MAGVPQIGSEIRYAIKMQSVVGETLTATGAHEINIDKMTTPTPVKEIAIPASTGAAGPTEDSFIYLTSGSILGLSLSGPLDVYDDFILSQCHFQKASEEATAPFAKTFTPYTTHPADTAVKVFTLWEYYPATGQCHVYRDCVVENYTNEGDIDGGDLVKRSVDIKALRVGYTEDVDAALSSWVNSGSAAGNEGGGYVHVNDLTATIDFGSGAVSVPLKAFSIKTGYDNAIGSYPDGAGGWNGYNITGQNGDYSITILKTDDNYVETALASLKAGTPIDITIEKGDGTAFLNYKDVVHGKIASPDIKKDNAAAIRATFTGKITKADASSDARSHTVVDGEDRGL